jgi:ABC-type multidrug transport system ATPase subunit
LTGATLLDKIRDVSPNEALVRASSLRKTFGSVDAVTELSFELQPGEVVGLLGPNGAGKTTTLKLLLGMLRPTQGSAQVMGLDCTLHAREVKERLGYSPDEPSFYNFLTGRETLDFVLAVRGLDGAPAWARLEPLVQLLDFTSQLDVLTSNYSHGTKKKLALLVALAHEPRVLLLDEPTNGLDPPTAHRVRELLQRKAAEGAAILVSTHLLDMADRLCDRVLILNQGRMIAEGTPASVRAHAGVDGAASLEDAFLKLVA